jgi:hypothetical protein
VSVSVCVCVCVCVCTYTFLENRSFCLLRDDFKFSEVLKFFSTTNEYQTVPTKV